MSVHEKKACQNPTIIASNMKVQKKVRKLPLSAPPSAHWPHLPSTFPFAKEKQKEVFWIFFKDNLIFNI